MTGSVIPENPSTPGAQTESTPYLRQSPTVRVARRLLDQEEVTLGVPP
jgi:hypothetical protein